MTVSVRKDVIVVVDGAGHVDGPLFSVVVVVAVVSSVNVVVVVVLSVNVAVM